MNKICEFCKEPISELRVLHRAKFCSGLCGTKACNKRWRDLGDSRRYFKLYGITLEDYNKLLAVQGGKCAICRKPPKGRVRLHVDHDHKTSLIRGLLCFTCNHGLGSFYDDVTLLSAATRYLNKAEYVNAHVPTDMTKDELSKVFVRGVSKAYAEAVSTLK